MKKVYIQTFGCQMNTADSAEMMLHLTARGCSSCASLDEADIVLINTCTIREHAEHKALSFLGRLSKWKAKDSSRIIIFAGCAAQRLGNSLKRRYPYTDIIAGAKDIDGFADILDSSSLFNAPQSAQEDKTKSPVALVNIMRGCSCKCSYCIVPYVRGEASSIEPDLILKNVERKTAGGAKEIVLLGQTVNAYRYKDVNFSKLLKLTAQVSGVARIRYLSPHPIFIDREFADTVAQTPAVAKHIHLPVQSGSTKVLADMKRGYTREDFLQKAQMLKEAGVCISTDIIVGYPTETEEDFLQTVSLCDAAEFVSAYCFKFSPRAGTPASLLNTIDDKEVEKRLDILLNKIKQNSKEAYARQLGTTQSVLMETPFNGRTLNNFWVRTTKKYKAGEIVELRITEAKDTILLA